MFSEIVHNVQAFIDMIVYTETNASGTVMKMMSAINLFIIKKTSKSTLVHPYKSNFNNTKLIVDSWLMSCLKPSWTIEWHCSNPFQVSNL